MAVLFRCFLDFFSNFLNTSLEALLETGLVSFIRSRDRYRNGKQVLGANHRQRI